MNDLIITDASPLTGMLAETAGKKSGYTPINEIFIPEGFQMVSSEIPEADIVEWATQNADQDFWKNVAEYFLN